MNTFTIEFKGPKDLAKKIAEYNELLNGPKVQPMEPEPIKCVFVKNEPKQETAPKVVEEPSETELDIENAEIDPQVYWNDFKDWLKHVGAEGVKAALDVFRNHGVNGKPNSGDLTPEIMQELNALMGK